MLKIGIICPSEIAYRRFMPAVQKLEGIEYIGVAYATAEEWTGQKTVVTPQTMELLEGERTKAESFVTSYGGKVFHGYEAMLQSGEIDAVYIPLPPALHFVWARKALEYGLHTFIEKPSTTCLADTEQLLEIAAVKKLAVHENYMFAYHAQLPVVQEVIDSGTLGAIRQIRIDFGFPRRKAGDFRYNRSLGGGALLDCGGYTLKYADMLLGGRARIQYARVFYDDSCDVEIFGTAALTDDEGRTVQVAFGMDNDYRCNIDVWGSKGTLTSNRILTAPEGFVPEYQIRRNGETETVKLPADDTFGQSIERFITCVREDNARLENYELLRHQEQLVDAFMEKAGMK